MEAEIFLRPACRARTRARPLDTVMLAMRWYAPCSVRFVRNGSSQNNGERDILPADVRELLDTSVESVDALDALLLLSRDASRSWAVGDVALAIGIDERSARHALADLKSRGLASDVVCGEVFRIAVLTPLSLRAFAALSSACAVDRRAVVEYISRRSMGRLKLLAQAFTRGRAP